MGFENRAYVVTGASGGIGSAVCRALSAGGARVLCAARASERLDSIAGETGGKAFALDGRDPAQVNGAFETAAGEFGRLDGAVNCIGSILLKPAHLTSDGEWDETIALNLNTAFFVLRAAARHIRDAGSVVLVSTAAARTGLPNHEAIAAAKGGVIGLTLSAAASYAARRLRVNCVAPGLVESPLTQRITSNERAREASIAMHPMGRLGRPEDVARAVLWLLDPEQSWVTGQILGVDGGLGTIRAK